MRNEILDTETAIQKTEPEHQEYLRRITKKYIPHLKKYLTDKDKSTLHTIKQKQSQNHLTFVKGN